MEAVKSNGEKSLATQYHYRATENMIRTFVHSLYLCVYPSRIWSVWLWHL